MNKFLKVIIAFLLMATGCIGTMQADTRKILVVGNSFSYDAVLQELLPIVQSAGDDIVIGFPYKGGTTLELHWDYISNKTQIYNYYTISGGTQKSTGSSSKVFDASIVKAQDWDAVVIQTDHNYSGSYEHYFPYLTDIMSFIKENLTNQDATFYLYMTWAYQNGSSKLSELVSKGLYTDQMDQYNKIVDCAWRAAKEAGIDENNIIPGGTAVQNGRTSYIGDNYNRDGYHMNLEYGRYTVSLTWYEKLFGKSALDITYKPTTISTFCANMCRNAAHKAILNPKEVTSLSDDFGVDPDAVVSPLDRPVRVNFGVSDGSGTSSDCVWNNMTAYVKDASLTGLYNSAGYGTDLKINISQAFAGVETSGASTTETSLNMTSKMSRSSFYGTTGSGSITISGLYPGQKYDIDLFASASSEDVTEYKVTGTETTTVTLNVNDNASNVATAKAVVADDLGRIIITVAAAEGSKQYYIGAMMITPDLDVPGVGVITPFEPTAKDPWDGTSMVEPRVDAAGNYLIYCGAELAWIANQVNLNKTVNGVKLMSNIDLGNKPWTPIGFGTKLYFNGKFDGKGYHITNFYINRTDLTEKACFGGLFGWTNSEDCDITNLYLSGKIEVPAAVTAKTQVGSFIGKANALGKMTNCHSDVEIVVDGTPGYVGGLIGFMKNANVSNCSYSGTITVNNKVTNGVGGLVATTNSSVEGIEAWIHGCYFNGAIDYKGSTKPYYAAAFNSYSNISMGAESITDNYSSGTINITGSKGHGVASGVVNSPSYKSENNYALDIYPSGFTATGVTYATDAQFKSGEIAWLLNGNQMEFLIGQDLSDPDSYPVVYSDALRVYRVEYVVDKETYTVQYTNAELHLPADPELENFDGWADEAGKDYTDGTVLDGDKTLYAKTKVVTSVDAIESSDVVISLNGKTMSISSPAAIGNVAVYSIDGKMLLSTNISDNTATISLDALQSGMYVARAANRTAKIMVE